MKNLSRKDLLARVGNIRQLAYVRHYRIDDGLGVLMRALEINNGSGLVFCVLPDRGMDISHASYKGINLAFLTPNADSSPAFYESEGIGWLRTFNAGLLTTCGLTHFGPPFSGEENFGLHGRYSVLPAKTVNDNSGWRGGEYSIEVSGTVEEASIFGSKLRLKRKISCKAGEPVIYLEDIVENFGSEKSPFMILYHINLGFPLVSENAKIRMNAIDSLPRDENAVRGFSRRFVFETPTKGFKEEVFFHRLEADSSGWSSVELENKDTALLLRIEYDSKNLPYLTQWKMAGISDYVLGLEPCNCPCMDRGELKSKKLIQYLGPGQKKKIKMKISINHTF